MGTEVGDIFCPLFSLSLCLGFNNLKGRKERKSDGLLLWYYYYHYCCYYYYYYFYLLLLF